MIDVIFDILTFCVDIMIWIAAGIIIYHEFHNDFKKNL
jgi:hypothetical protein